MHDVPAKCSLPVINVFSGSEGDNPFYGAMIPTGHPPPLRGPPPGVETVRPQSRQPEGVEDVRQSAATGHRLRQSAAGRVAPAGRLFRGPHRARQQHHAHTLQTGTPSARLRMGRSAVRRGSQDGPFDATVRPEGNHTRARRRPPCSCFTVRAAGIAGCCSRTTGPCFPTIRRSGRRPRDAPGAPRRSVLQYDLRHAVPMVLPKKKKKTQTLGPTPPW